MKMTNMLPVAFMGFLTLASCNNSGDSEKQADKANQKVSTMNTDDSKFMTEAASGGMMEVQGGQIALKRSNSKVIKDFGQEMVTDHSKANEELKALASEKNVVLPTALSNDDQSEIDKLNKADAKDFDKEYAKMMVDDHTKDVDAFQKTANNAQDPDLKAWAGKTLPVLQHHLEMAKMAKDSADAAYKSKK